MSELQLSCLVLVLFCFIVLIAYLLYRCANLQRQVDQLRIDVLKTKAAYMKVIY